MGIFQKTCIHFLITQFDQQACSVHGTWYMSNGWTVYHVPETGTHGFIFDQNHLQGHVVEQIGVYGMHGKGNC